MAIWRKVRLGALAAACLAGAAVACRQLVGIADDPPRADSTACGWSYAAGDCASCIASNCCSESSACASSTTCRAYETCLAACTGDAACRGKCEGDHPPGTGSDVPALDACLASNCASPCNLGCGSVADSFTPPDAAGSCESCLASTACEVERACAGSRECEEYVRCTNACTTFGCQQSCGPDAGASPFAALSAIVSGSCASACAYGGDWLCVGHVSWPAPSGSTTTLTVLVSDQLTGSPVPGAVVAPCSANVQSCVSLADAGTTDQAGLTTLEVPQVATLPNGFYLLVTPPPADGGSGAFLTALDYLRSPLTESTKAIAAPVMTEQEVGTFYGQLGVTREAGAGSLRATVFDCDLHKAPGAMVTVTTAAGTSLPVVYGIQPGATATDVTGAVEIGNVPPGLVEITVTPPGGGPPSSKAAVFSRADAYTTVSMLPTP